MTPDAQRIAIAEAVGWRVNQFREGEAAIDYWHHIDGRPGGPPDYLGDLNACAEMEKALTEEQFRKYVEILTLAPLAKSDGYAYARATVCATAPQRCEAFLKALSLWQPRAEEL